MYPQYRHLMGQSSTTEGHIDILKNAIENAVDRQTFNSLCTFICFVVVVVHTDACCSSSAIEDPQLQMNNNNKITQLQQ